MEFLYPGFLYALAAISIPILVHLFNFRKFKKIAFTNVRFLKEIKQKTQNQNKLKHLLVLLMRILATAALVFAFAQPYFPVDNQDSSKLRKSISIFVDNSFSMQGESEGGEMLEVAKNSAIDISQVFSNQDQFQILTQDFQGQHQHLVGQDVFASWTSEIDFSASSQPLAQIVERQSDILLQNSGSSNLEAYIISDFQKSRYDFSNLEIDSAITLSLVHLERGTPANLYIDSVWFESPIRTLNGTESLKIRIVNTGDDDVENVPLKLTINGEQKAIGSFGTTAKTSADTALYFVHDTPGLKELVVSLEDHPVTYDDAYYLVYDVYEKIQIKAIVDDPLKLNGNLKAVFNSDSTLVYASTMFNQIDYSTLNENDLLVLNELEEIPSGLTAELVSFASKGGSIWVIPSKEADRESYNALLSGLNAEAIVGASEGDFAVKNLNVEHPIFKGVFQKLPKNVDLPKCTFYYKLSRIIQSQGDQIMGFSNGDAFLSSSTIGNGTAYFSTSQLSDEGNSFSRHALFVTTALRMAELSKSSEPNVLSIGNSTIDLKLPANISLSDESVVHLINEDLEVDVIPLYHYQNGRLTLSPGPEITAAGNYQIRIGDKLIGAIGMNFDRKESDLSSFDIESLSASISETANQGNIRIFDGNTGQLKSEIAKESRGEGLWKICLILGLIFLLIETVLLRFWK